MVEGNCLCCLYLSDGCKSSGGASAELSFDAKSINAKMSRSDVSDSWIAIGLFFGLMLCPFVVLLQCLGDLTESDSVSSYM